MKERYPISFTKKNEYSNSDFRFIDVSIDVMHTGSNRNKTSFTKDVISKAIPSICNTPILGYVVDELDEEDKEFNDPVDIFTRDGTKNHSVELTDMACGPADKNGDVPVGSFLFDGCCILSTTDPKIQPAMTGSCVTANFSVEDITSQIRERLYEYQALQQNYTAQNENPSDEEKGDITPMNENEKNSVVTENTTTKNPEIETPPAENAVQEPETQTTENSVPTEGEGEAPATNNTVANADEGTTAPTENTAPTTEGEPAGAQEFTLTIMQLTDEVSSILAEQKTPSKWDPEYMVPRYWMNDIQDNEVIVMDYSTYRLMGIPYSMNGDNVVLDFENAKRKKVSYADWDEGEVLSGITAAFTEMNTKMTQLNNKFQTATADVNEKNRSGR